MKSLSLVATLVLGLAASAAGAERWTLDFTPVKVGTVIAHGVSGPGSYLYCVAQISNPSAQEVPLSVFVDVTTDVKGRTYRAGFDPTVNAAVERRLGRDLKTLSEAGASLNAGGSVEVILTFGKVDPQIDTFVVHVRGLKDRVYTDQYKTWVEDAVLNLTYHRSGDEFYRQYDLLGARGKSWSLVEPRKELPRR